MLYLPQSRLMSLNGLDNPPLLLHGTTTTTKLLPIIVDISHSLPFIVATKAQISPIKNVQAKVTKASVNCVINKVIVPNAALASALISLQLLLSTTLPLLPHSHQIGFLILLHLIMSQMISTISHSPRHMKVRMLLL